QRLVAAQAKTDLKVSAGIRYLSELNDAALLVGVNVPIGQQKRTLPLSNVARARQAQIPLESEQLRRELFGTLVGLHAEIEQRKLALTAIRDDMVPRADESLELYREGYDLGGFSLLELTEAQNMALGLRQELVAVAAELHELRIELSRLTGDSQTLGGTT
ncbi:MAG: TolC family protein, partial [Gammaproteobacteria bacterium]|nr:TolC family protein [Gammaproteobacteria bacterium]